MPLPSINYYLPFLRKITLVEMKASSINYKLVFINVSFYFFEISYFYKKFLIQTYVLHSFYCQFT